MNPFAPQLEHIAAEPPRNLRTLRGLEFKRAIRGGPLLFLVPFLFIVPLMFGLMIPATDPQMRSERRAGQGNLKTAAGIVTKAGWEDDTRTNIHSFVIQYSFKLNGLPYYGKATPDRSSPLAKLKTGATLPVLYAPENPALNGLPGEWGKNPFPTELFFIIPIFFLLMFAPLIVWPAFRLRQARRIFKQGTLATGHVDWVKKQTIFSFNGPYTYNFEIYFHFQNAAGETVRATQITDNDWLVQQLAPASEITVIYLPKKPQQAIFLEAYIE